MRVLVCARPVLLALLAAGTFAPTALAQSAGAAVSGTGQRSEYGLVSVADAEEKRGVDFSYTQNYRSAGKPVLFKGSLYAGITAFKVNKCSLAIGTRIVDRYSGQIGKSTIKDTQSIYDYSVEFTLTQELADSLRLAEVRPSQLENGTNPACSEKRACAIDWLEFRAKGPVIKMTILTNDIEGYDGFVRNFDGMVDQFRIPVSSSDAGNTLIAKLQSLAIMCRQ